MKDKPKISDAEWKVMQVVWSKGEATANDVTEAVEGEKEWNPKTVRTLINRLVSKGVLSHESKGRQYVYRPLLNEEECVKAETKSFLDRISRRAFKPMMAAFVEEHDLSREEIEELKKILDKKKK